MSARQAAVQNLSSLVERPVCHEALHKASKHGQRPISIATSRQVSQQSYASRQEQERSHD